MTDAGHATHGTGRRRPRRRRRHPAPLLVIVAVGALAIAGALALARALAPDRPAGPYVIAAWTFGDRASLARAAAAGALDEVLVDWLQSRADGSVAAPRADEGFVDAARAAGCRVLITLTDYDEATRQFDPSIADAVLATPETRRRHVAAVAGYVREHDYDGLDLDWEALRSSQRGAFTAFVEALADALHEDGRILSVTVYPKLSEPGGWDAPRAQDWARLGDAADRLTIMTYNFSGSWSGPGPLSPPAWMDRVLDFAASRVSPHKTVVGVGFYGRDWRGAQTTDLVWDDLQRLRAGESPTQRRGVSRELRLDYRRDGAHHVSYFPDAPAVGAKLDMVLAEHPGVLGISCWLMGQEDPAVWEAIAERLRD